MGKNESKFQENISKAYLEAVAANSEVVVLDFKDQDFDGIDMHLMVNSDARRVVAIQLKSTINYVIEESYIKYDLKSKNHNDLCEDNMLPTMLFLLVLPDNKDEWVNYSSDKLILKNTLYWLDYSKESKTNNKSTVRVSIPINQFVESDNLVKIVTAVSKGCAIDEV